MDDGSRFGGGNNRSRFNWACENKHHANMRKHDKKLKSAVAILILSAFPWLGSYAGACTIGEEAQIQFPFNVSGLSNADRLAITDSVIEAKKWPDVGIQAVVIAGAYFHEHNLEHLKESRAKNVAEYLQQLGIKREHILIDKKTFNDEMVVKRPDGSLEIHQVIVELTPICKGSGASLCDDPRVTPHSRAIK